MYPSQRPSDLEFLITALDQLGEIVKEDVKLGTLFVPLILAKPRVHLFKPVRKDPSLLRVQREMAIHLFCYLKHKGRNSTLANTETDSLLMQDNIT